MNTADVTGVKPNAVLLQAISGLSAINPLVAFYDIKGGKRELLFFIQTLMQKFNVSDTENYLVLKLCVCIKPNSFRHTN
jgi:hypothetical protein